MRYALTARCSWLSTLNGILSLRVCPSYVSTCCRWINLWPPASFSETFLPRSVSDDLEEKEGRDDAPGGMNAAVFLGNIALFLGLLMIIIVVHVAIAAAIEAHWLTKVRLCRCFRRTRLSFSCVNWRNFDIIL